MFWSNTLDLAFEVFVIGIISGLFLGIVSRLFRWVVDIINNFIK